jgi:creatinine amidohydrolase
MSARDWADLRAPDFPPPEGTVAVLPTAAIEQHGPHLPVGTDTLIAEGMLAEVRTRCPAELGLLILPVQAVGKSNEHLWARGTLTLDAEAALKSWLEIGLSVARAGVRRLILVNAHGGNWDLLGIVARELRIRAGMLAVKCQWTGFGWPDGLYSAQETAFGIHGGDLETSLMLAFRPETVDMGQARDFRSSAEGAPIPPTGPLAYAWVSSDLNPAGVVGQAHMATAEKGRATAAHQAEVFLRLAAEVAAHPMSGFAPVT